MDTFDTVKLPETIEEAVKLTTDGTYEMYKGNFTGAIAIFDRVLELHPDSLFAYQYRAICRHHIVINTRNVSNKSRANSMEDVISDIKKALEISKIFQSTLASLP